MTNVYEDEEISKSHESQVKRKRTKRNRQASAFLPSTSGGVSSTTTTEEETEMANCLMLLSQAKSNVVDDDKTQRLTTLNFFGLDESNCFRCKTCNRSFPSFQALGGHRASHKIKIKNSCSENSSNPSRNRDENDRENEIKSTECRKLIGKVEKPGDQAVVEKVHRCSTCSAEFSSGQALGGHMRRHRNTNNNNNTNGDNDGRKRRIMELDLNLPAPEDNCGEFGLSLGSVNDRILVFSATSLIDCPY